MYCTWGVINKASYIVDLGVEMFGTPCKDPSEHPAPGNGNAPWMTVINKVASPCNTLLFGTDNLYSVQADEYTLKEFVANNAQFSATSMGSVLHTAWAASNEKVKLFGRYKIEMGCSSQCQDFRITPIATAMYNQMVSTYGDIKTILYITCIGSGVALMVMGYLVYIRSNATQREYLNFFVFVLLLVVVLIILLSLLLADMRNVYNVNRNKLNVGSGCITDAGWKKLTQQMFLQSNMDSEHNWTIFFLVWSILTWLSGSYVLCKVMAGLDRLNKGWVGDVNEFM